MPSPRTLPWLLLLSLALGCSGEDTSVGFGEPLRVKDAQFREGQLPGLPALTADDLNAGVQPTPPSIQSVSLGTNVIAGDDPTRALHGKASADSAAVMTVRLKLAPDGPATRVSAGSGDAGGATAGGGVRGAGIAGWTCCSTVGSFGRACSDGCGSSVAQSMGTSGPVGSGIDRLSAAGRATDLDPIVPARTESDLRATDGLSGSS